MCKPCVRDTDLRSLDEVGQHDDVGDMVLPDHSPMVHYSIDTGS